MLPEQTTGLGRSYRFDSGYTSGFGNPVVNHPPAQQQATEQFGFDSEEVAEHIRTRMDEVENAFPVAQLELLRQGGYEVPLGENYSSLAQYSIRTYGRYLMALTDGTITPFHPQEERFIAVTKGKKPPLDTAEKGWLTFLSEYPEFRGR